MEESVKKGRDTENIESAKTSEVLVATGVSPAAEGAEASTEAVATAEKTQKSEFLGVEHCDESDIRAALKEAIEVAVEEAAEPSDEKLDVKLGLEPSNENQANKSKPPAVIAELDKIIHAQRESAEKKENTDSEKIEKFNAVEESEENKNLESGQNSKQAAVLSNEENKPLEEEVGKFIEEAQSRKNVEKEPEKEIKGEEQKKDSDGTAKEEPAEVKSPVSLEEIEKAEKNEESKESENVCNSEAFSQKTKKRWVNFDFLKSFALDVLFLAICIFFFFALATKWFASQQVTIIGTNQIQSSIESGEKVSIGNINILVMGVDSVEGTHRSDTIFVLGVNPSKSKMTMLSIPRDTRIIIEDRARKINEILPRYGEGTVRKIIEDLLKINISRKIEVGFESFIGVIDALGGVDINIEKAMDYDDNWGNLHIHFKPGMNHLDGKNALNYVRFRKDAMADLGRIKRQQEFVKVVIKKLMSPSSIIRLPSILEKAFEYIDTDFTLPEILTLVKGFENFDIRFNTLSLPGEARYIDKISYFMPYSDEAVTIGNSYFSDYALFELEKDFETGKVIQKNTSPNRKNK